jgi:formylglycine-generating enzyme required for sulfatase activity
MPGPATHDVITSPAPSTDATSSPSELAAPFAESVQRLGRYRVEQVLGQGGFGRVYLAWDEDLQRRVAIKVASRVATDASAEAYLAEARIVARLDHPHIVPVYDVGRTEQGQLFAVSRLIDGRDLADCLESRRLTLEQSARLVATIAEALHHAHERGLVHRDIKPQNLLLDESGRPHVCDFGLALRDEDHGMGPELAGTPAYMSPEQARCEGHRVDRRSDIFSLGVVLYELITGERPFPGHGLEVLRHIAHEEATAPRLRNPAIPAELDRICQRCLAKRAVDRYTTAADLAADLEEFLRGDERAAERRVFRVVPRGLRSFGTADADFFPGLLPGPRDARGLPEGLAFWLHRLEETEAERTFPVGLIYGPSGCGKSSLVKAGLLPRLGERVRAVYVEATAQDTEARLLNGLIKACPGAGEPKGLADFLHTLRRSGSRKVVLFLDQFEQWLHARHEFAGTELVAALRQCDGVRVQAVVLVRDDFWLAVSRFLKELEVPLVEGHNSALVDLFDLLHARKVLAEFGRAFGRLPEAPADLRPEQQRFLDDAVSGLARDGKVVSVRLALFAEMVKGKPWTKETLRQLGGAEGVGVTFLEETFGASGSSPEYRLHQKATRAVLQALLPEAGTDIKGHMRSQPELLQVSGYSDRPALFRDVLRILDQELRLITPTDPQGLGEGDTCGTNRPDDQLYYQLTHDYLVPALRRWLTHKQMETPRGRAELRLVERAALWNARPEPRRLPGWREYLGIRRLTDRRTWTEPQRRMMRQADRHHAQALVRRLLEADLADVSAMIGPIRQLRKWTEPLLRREQHAAAEPSQARLHTALALLAFDEDQLDYLYERLLQAAPSEFPILRDALAEHREKLSGRLWLDAETATNEDRRLHAAAALATFDSASPRWSIIAPTVAHALTRVSPEFLGDWKDALRPVRRELFGPLGAIFRDRELGELQQALATSTLADYTGDDVHRLADLIVDADPRHFAELFPVLARHGEAAIRALECELERVVRPDWADDPPDPDWRDVPADLRRAIEAAAGMIEERFVLCQTMPYPRFRDAVEQLRGCGYRPVRIRPHRVGASLRVAAVWTRDGRSWEWLGEADVEDLRIRDADLRRQGYVPVDVSVTLSGDGTAPRYAAVWEEANGTDPEVILIVGRLGEHEPNRPASPVEQRFDCQAANVVVDGEGQPHGASLWTRRADQARSTTRLFHGPSSDFREDDCPGLLLTDAQMSSIAVKGDGAEDSIRLTTALWNVSTQLESKMLHGLSITEQRLRGPALVADGFRPAAVSVVSDPEAGLPMSALVWHRPLVAESAKDRLARRQANAAVALLRLGRGRNVWPILQHRPDPRTRSYLIHRLSPLGADPNQVLEQLDGQVDVSIRRALILALGEFPEQQLPLARREPSIPRLLALYADDPDPGIHAAVAWTLRRWGRQAELESIDRQFATGKAVGSRRWFVNRREKTLVIIPPPGGVVIGSPPAEIGREGGPEGTVEMPRHVRIDHAFAVMIHQVTVAEMLEFRKNFFYRKYFSPEPACPINNVTWYDAVAYCNWLNEQEGIPREQWCYLPNDQGEYAQGMRIVPASLRRTGYRLPTEAEWEFACRAGAVTSRYYGQDLDLDNHYAWTVQNSLGRRTAVVGSLKPNDLGLFDMLGNTLDWCHNAFRDDSKPIEVDANDGPAAAEVVGDQQWRALRSPTLAHCPETVRAAFFDAYAPNVQVYGVAFRVSRTYLPNEGHDVGKEVRNAERQELRGSTPIEPSEGIRSSVRLRFTPNLGLFAFGFRPARTLDE